MSVRSILGALTAGLVFGLASGPSEAQAINFPLRINFAYCWGAVTPCAYPAAAGGYPATWVLQQNGNFQDNFGDVGTYAVDVANQRLELTYTASGVVYRGQHVGGGCFDGSMGSGGYNGTWAGCK